MDTKKINTTLTCVDAHVATNDTVIQQGKRYRGSFVYEDDDHVRFVEQNKPQPTEQKALSWRLLDRTKHGHVHINSRHVIVEFYVKHDEYENEAHLADMLAGEIETIGDSLCDIDLKKEVEKCC